MKVFLDANILVSVLNKEYPLFPFTSRILSANQHSQFQLFTSPLCLAIAFYFAEKKSKASVAKHKIEILVRNISIAGNSAYTVREALANRKVYDFEDGLEYYAAIESGCSCIITEDVKDFYFSEIEVLSSKEFLIKHLVK
ncbi:MAG TPA: PIN domain-containing protein [Daejeonella sp.]|nr:PIN domain-containing protein [Daejeonella sp.]